MSIHSQARSTEYHALQTKLQKRTSGGYWYLVSHTWSQTLTTQPAPGIGGNFTYDTGPAAFDIPHLLAMSFGAELPFGRGKTVPRRRGNARQRSRRRVAGAEHRELPQRSSVHADACRATWRTPARAGSGPTTSAIGRARQPDDRRVVRQDGVRRAAGLHVRKHRTRHSPRRPPVERGLLAVQAIQRHRIAVARVQGGGVQPSQLGLLRSAEHGDRYGGRRPGDRTSNAARQLQFGLKYLF